MAKINSEHVRLDGTVTTIMSLRIPREIYNLLHASALDANTSISGYARYILTYAMTKDDDAMHMMRTTVSRLARETVDSKHVPRGY